MRSIYVFMFCIVLLSSCWASAQELVYDEAIKVGYDSIDCGMPKVVFNGKEHGVFYYWSGAGDTDAGLHFRRLDENAQTAGPQVKIMESSYGYVEAAWDGEAYLVGFSPVLGKKAYLLRVSPKGKLLAQKTLEKERNTRLYIMGIFVIGEKVFLFFEKERKVGLFLFNTYLGQVDRRLTKHINVEQIPVGGFKNSYLSGVTHDTDKFLAMLFEFGEDGGGSYYKIVDVCLVHIDLSGKVIKQTNQVPVIQGTAKWMASPANGISESLTDTWDVRGLVNVGDGYIIVVSRAPYPDGSGLPYANQSFKIDEDGNILGGPYNLGGQYYIFGRGSLAGNHAAFWALDVWSLSSAFVALLGKKGAHIANSYYGEAHGNSIDMEWDGTNAYTGTANTIVYRLLKNFWAFTSTYNLVYANQYRMPKFSRPGFFYFKAGTAEPVKNHRLVMWSVVLGKNVTLTGPDFELKDLPPVWSYLVDTKGQKTKLTLSFTTEDGQTKKKRLVINP